MRMLQLRRRLDLAEKALAAKCRAEIRVQHLDGDIAVVLEIVREVDSGHAASADVTLDAVPVPDRGRESFDHFFSPDTVATQMSACGSLSVK